MGRFRGLRLRRGSFNQLLEGARLFGGCEIRSLDVFDNGDFQCFTIGQLTHQAGEFMKLGFLGCAPATFTGHDFEMIGPGFGRAHQNGLQKTLLGNGVRELLQVFRFEDFTRLIRIGDDVFDRN